jgi:hypothetical protein
MVERGKIDTTNTQIHDHLHSCLSTGTSITMVERGKIYTTNTQIHDHLHSCLSTGTSITMAGFLVGLVLLDL